MIKSVSLNTMQGVRTIICLMVLMSLPKSMSSQEVWTTQQFLDFERDNTILPFEENLNFINTKAKGMPFVDNYEFRTETDEMELERQRFQFRLEFNSKEERKAYDRILMANRDRYFWLQAQYKQEAKEDRYNAIVDLYFLQREDELMQQEFELLKDKKTVLKKLLDSKSDIEIADWIGNEDELFNLRLDSIDLEVQRKEIARTIFGAERSLPRIDVSNFLRLATIKNKLPQLLEEDAKNPDDEIAKAEMNIADAEYQLEIAEGNKWLNFAQIEYQADDRISFQREVGLGTSITLPSKRNNRAKKNEAALELIEKTYENSIQEEENKRELLFEAAKLRGLFNQLDELNALIEGQKLDEIFTNFENQKIVSPLVLISIKRSILKNKKKQLNLEKDIYDSYINVLSRIGAFVNQPETNYLSE